MNKLRYFYLLIITIIIAGETAALPRFALRMGGQCIDCHVNPTGGGIRDIGGWSFGKNMLPVRTTSPQMEMSNKFTENIQFGFDYRTQYLVRTTDSTSRSDFQNMTGSIYTAAAFSDEINVIARYDFIWQIWEAYAVAFLLPEQLYIKAGTFQPNYGIRIDDHTAYTRGGDLGLLFQSGQRQGLIYEPRYTETGIEAGYNFNGTALLTASAGSPQRGLFSADPSYTASLQITPSVSDDISLLIGGSASLFSLQHFSPTPGFRRVQMYGGFAGLGIMGLTLTGEYDIVNDYLAADGSSSALMIEAAYRLVKGVEAVVRYDRFDPDTKIEKNEFSRFIIGTEFFPYSFVELRPQYRIQLEEPSVSNNSFVLQFHFFY